MSIFGSLRVLGVTDHIPTLVSLRESFDRGIQNIRSKKLEQSGVLLQQLAISYTRAHHYLLSRELSKNTSSSSFSLSSSSSSSAMNDPDQLYGAFMEFRSRFADRSPPPAVAPPPATTKISAKAEKKKKQLSAQLAAEQQKQIQLKQQLRQQQQQEQAEHKRQQQQQQREQNRDDDVDYEIVDDEPTDVSGEVGLDLENEVRRVFGIEVN